MAHGVSARVAASALVGLDQDVSDAVFRGLDNCHWIELVEAGKSFSGGGDPVAHQRLEPRALER